jgi:hypothetical protein
MLIALMLVALAASSPDWASTSSARDRPENGRRASDSRPLPGPPRIVQEDHGFHWRDAAVGGAAALGLILVLAGGDALRARRHERGWLRE